METLGATSGMIPAAPLLSAPPGPTRADDPAAAPVLRVRGIDLCRGLGSTRTANLSFDVQAGEMLVVLGGNGSGKSLLVKYLAGIFHAGPGRVQFRADRSRGDAIWLDMARRAERERARAGLGVVFQRPALVRTLTVAQNVALALPPATTRQAAAVEIDLLLRLVGIERLAHAYPHELSAGDGQCAAVARALAGGRHLLLCDEPHAALGPATTHRLGELLRTLVHAGTLAAAVICTQDLGAALRLGHRFLLLGTGTGFGGGRLHDTADALRADPEFRHVGEPAVAPLSFEPRLLHPAVHPSLP